MGVIYVYYNGGVGCLVNIPVDLVNQAKEGRLVLLLGAGASLGSKKPDGRECPTTPKLGRLLSTALLGGYLQDGPLSQIAGTGDK